MSTEILERYSVEYLEYNGISRDRSAESLARLQDLFDQAGGMDAVDGPAFRTFLQGQLDAGKVPTTVGKIRGIIRPFFQWAWEQQIIDAQQLMEVNAVKAPRGAGKKGKPRPYSRAEVRKMWKDLDRRHPLPQNSIERAVWELERWERGVTVWRPVKVFARRMQTRAIISLALMGGIRRQEIYDLSVNDVHFDNAYVLVTGAKKNAHAEPIERIVPWTTGEMRLAVEEWLDLRARLKPSHDSPWLCLWSAATYTLPLSWDRFVEIPSSIGKWEYHRFRHTAATEMLRAGYSLETVQKIMGHSRIQQTLAYAELLPDDVLRVAGNCESELSLALSPQ